MEAYGFAFLFAEGKDDVSEEKKTGQSKEESRSARSSPSPATKRIHIDMDGILRMPRGSAPATSQRSTLKVPNADVWGFGRYRG